MIDHKNHYARYCELISLAASSAPARQRDGGYMAAVYILSADKTLCDIARRKICPDGISFPGILSVARRAELSDSQFTAIRSAHNLFNGGSSSSVTPYDLALCDYLTLDIITQPCISGSAAAPFPPVKMAAYSLTAPASASAAGLNRPFPSIYLNLNRPIHCFVL